MSRSLYTKNEALQILKLLPESYEGISLWHSHDTKLNCSAVERALKKFVGKRSIGVSTIRRMWQDGGGSTTIWQPIERFIETQREFAKGYIRELIRGTALPTAVDSDEMIQRIVSHDEAKEIEQVLRRLRTGSDSETLRKLAIQLRAGFLNGSLHLDLVSDCQLSDFLRDNFARALTQRKLPEVSVIGLDRKSISNAVVRRQVVDHSAFKIKRFVKDRVSSNSKQRVLFGIGSGGTVRDVVRVVLRLLQTEISGGHLEPHFYPLSASTETEDLNRNMPGIFVCEALREIGCGSQTQWIHAAPYFGTDSSSYITNAGGFHAKVFVTSLADARDPHSNLVTHLQRMRNFDKSAADKLKELRIVGSFQFTPYSEDKFECLDLLPPRLLVPDDWKKLSEQDDVLTMLVLGRCNYRDCERPFRDKALLPLMTNAQQLWCFNSLVLDRETAVRVKELIFNGEG